MTERMYTVDEDTDAPQLYRLAALRSKDYAKRKGLRVVCTRIMPPCLTHPRHERGRLFMRFETP